MLSIQSKTVLLLGFHELQNEELKLKIRSLPYNFINPLELKLNQNLKEEISGVLILGSNEDVHLIYELPNLKIISCNTSGLDHLDLETLFAKNVLVKNVPAETADSTSNIGMILILNTSRNVKKAIDALQNPTMYHNSILYKGIEIRDKTLGIVGLGAIGQCLAHKASLAFGMNIMYHQRNKRSESSFEYYSNLNEMLPLVDFLAICCPFTKSTKNMINLDKMKLMKSSAILINIARGGIVNTDDLVEALRSTIIAGAGLDVTDPEPLPNQHPLLCMDNVFLLPHVGTHTEEALYGMVMKAICNLNSYFNHIPSYNN